MMMMMMSCTERVVVLVDMDCFYCQVEEQLDSNLKGKPIAVVQYNTWRGGGIIAVNYPAREKGVTRHMRGNEAKQKCPEIVLARVPEVRGKADLTKYREAGKKVAEVLQTFTPMIERASVDEAYLDITEVVNKRILTDVEKVHINNLKNTYIVGYSIQDFLHNVVTNTDFTESNCRLAMGGVIAEEIRAAVYERTGYKCSAGIAHNKILAKLVCGLNKPNKQTILPHESVAELYKDLPIKKLTGFGGKFGKSISQRLKISKMGELIAFTQKQLIKEFDEKTGKWLYNIARGIDYEPVTPRLISKSIGCCKNFPGRSSLKILENVQHWVNELACELSERLEKDAKENNRKAKNITLHFTQAVKGRETNSSRTLPLSSYDQSRIVQIALDTLKTYCSKSDGTYNIKYLGFSVGNFEANKKIGSISQLFKNMKEQKYLNMCQLDALQLTTLHDSSLSDRENKHNTLQDEQNCIETKSLNENNINNAFKENANFSNEDLTHEDNISVYSADTIDLNEDTENLIYYEDIYPESVAGQPILVKSLNSSNSINNGSAPEEIILENSCPIKDLGSFGESSSSFFSKFFENYNNDESCSPSPVDRSFDKSKILHIESSDENFNKSSEEENEIQTNSLLQFKNPREDEDDSDLTEICPECKKKISKSEFGSHMDYHYALRIVKDEAHMYKSTQNTAKLKSTSVQESICNNSTQSIKKRKVDTKPIHRYLQIGELNDQNSELCQQCNKRIKLDDVENHMDYHIAKQLHLEINPKSFTPSSMKSVDNKQKQAKNQRKNSGKEGNNVGKILSFLNRVNT